MSCESFQDWISADLDGELSAADQDTLAGHLASCAGCRAHRARLQRLRPLLRGARPQVPVDADALERLQRRLAAEHGAPAAGEARPPSGRVVRYDWAAVRVQVLQIAAALALVAGGAWMLIGELTSEPAPIGQGSPRPSPEPTAPTPSPSALASKTPDPTPPPSVAPSPTATAEPSPSPSELPPPPGGWPTPRPSASPSPTGVASPSPSPTGTPGDTRVRDPQPSPTPVETPRPIDLAALGRLIDEARSQQTPTEQRANVLVALAGFDHPRAYAFLGEVLDGELDRLPEPEASRAAAWRALGALGTEAAAKALLGATRRKGDDGRRDSGHLLAALSRLRTDAAAGRVADALGRRGVSEDDRGLLLAVLGRLANPTTTPAVLAFHQSRQPLWLRRESAQVLGRLGDPQALPALLEALGSRRAAIRQGAAAGLGLLAARAPETAPRGLPALAAALADKEPSVRVAAIRGLASSGHLFAVPCLIERLDPEREPRRDVRERVRDALVRLTGIRFADAAAARAWLFGPAPLPLPGGGLLAIQADEGLDRLARRAGRVVFLVDASGSMAPAGKFSLARYELVRALEALPADHADRVGFDVILFADGTKSVFGDFVSSSDRGKVREAVAAVEAEQARSVAQTDLLRALQSAFARDAVDTVILISDGLLDAQHDPEALLWQIERQNQRRAQPVTIHAVHVRGGGAPPRPDPADVDPDHPSDVNLMKRLARESGGVYLRNGS